MNRTLIDQALPTRMTREQAEQFAAWLEEHARHVRWCVDMPETRPNPCYGRPRDFEWATTTGDIARIWIANNVGGDFT